MAAPTPLVQSTTVGALTVHAIQAGGQKLDGGAMFGVARWLPFTSAAVLGTMLSCTLPVLLRTMPGRAAAGDEHGFDRVGGAEVAAAGALPAAVHPTG